MKLHTRILTGLVLGAAIGALAHLQAAASLRTVVIAAEPLGTAFIKLATMVVVPLVVASLFTGIASLGDIRRLGRIGGRTLAFFLATTFLAATLGLVLALVLRTGSEIDPSIRAKLLSGTSTTATGAASASHAAPGIGQVLLSLIPQNPFAAAAAGDLLPLIVATCLFAAAATAIPAGRRQPLVSFFEAVNDLSMVLIRWIMQLAPAAVLVLIATVVAQTGIALLESLLWFAVVTVLALAVHVAVVLMPALRVSARMGIADFVRKTGDALLLAFSTASSSATLPVSMSAAGTRVGLPPEIVSFVLPAGTTLNKNGAAVYKAVTAVFLAHVYGLPLDPTRLLAIVVASTVAAFAGAGIPGSSLVTTLIVLNAIGLGAQASAGIALVAGIDRPLDMCRTAVNTFGNLVGTAVVARSRMAAGELPATSPAV
jgi:Na+/H+-dicarboxylate symporter